MGNAEPKLSKAKKKSEQGGGPDAGKKHLTYDPDETGITGLLCHLKDGSPGDGGNRWVVGHEYLSM